MGTRYRSLFVMLGVGMTRGSRIQNRSDLLCGIRWKSDVATDPPLRETTIVGLI